MRRGTRAWLGSVPEMMEWGLVGPAPSGARALRFRVVAIVAFVGAWSLVSVVVVIARLFNPIFFPGPWVVIGKIVDMGTRGHLALHVGATLERVAIGFVTGALLALALGIPAGRLRPLGNLVEPIVEVLRPIPPLAVLPLFIVWVGIGEASKVLFITYATFFPMFVTTVHAVRQVDPLLLRAARSLGARRAQLFLRVVVPAAMPDIFTGLRLGVALSFFVIVISEFIGAEEGLGYLINDGRNFFLVPQMLGAAIVLGLCGYAANAILRLVERRLLAWQSPGRA